MVLAVALFLFNKFECYKLSFLPLEATIIALRNFLQPLVISQRRILANTSMAGEFNICLDNMILKMMMMIKLKEIFDQLCLLCQSKKQLLPDFGQLSLYDYRRMRPFALMS